MTTNIWITPGGYTQIFTVSHNNITLHFAIYVHTHKEVDDLVFFATNVLVKLEPGCNYCMYYCMFAPHALNRTIVPKTVPRNVCNPKIATGAHTNIFEWQILMTGGDSQRWYKVRKLNKIF